MPLKDYYKLLELPPSADRGEIKKAYRRLAHQYHPDKNGDDPYAMTRFAAIKEAYETLINPAKKEEYLQQRWYAQSTGRFKTQEIITPFSILQQLLELERWTSQADIHRMDRAWLLEKLQLILSSEAVEILNTFRELHINEKIISLALKCCRFLPYQVNSQVIQKLEMTQTSGNMQIYIRQFVKSQQRSESWEKKTFGLVLLVVIILCVLIYFSSR